MQRDARVCQRQLSYLFNTPTGGEITNNVLHMTVISAGKKYIHRLYYSRCIYFFHADQVQLQYSAALRPCECPTKESTLYDTIHAEYIACVKNLYV